MKETPVAVYKYLTAERTVSVLENLQIRFSQASVLNDPKELKPLYKGIAARSDAKALLTDRLRKRYPDIVERVERSLPSPLAAELIDDIMAKAVVQAEASLPHNAQKIYDRLDTNFGILSLSETATEPLLWGYYGDGGYGYLIHFDPSHKWFWAQKEDKDDFRHLRRVVYVADRSAKLLVCTTGDDLLYTKDFEWQHEKEWRIIRNFNDAAAKVGPDQYGKDVLLFAIPPDCIKSVVIGSRAKPESVDKIRSIIQKNSALSHVHVHQAVLTGGTITLVDKGTVVATGGV